ncbi:SPOR domain-containing protein [Martelella mediterranea]|uniref:Sporulation related protein n=1 Tax=Martelella mediterranea TaxID=293089 RepID=A0A4R3NL82_9HYPH|nr:SPOR domain-containing protein [Martelella mediterranea]TCT34811.1 sporulation related protein [Martelella mediterranea]
MAEKNKPDFDNQKSGDIAPDDPFAELARLIAPEAEAPRRKEEPSLEDAPHSVTEADLADELLRGLDHQISAYPEDPQPGQPSSFEDDEPYREFTGWSQQETGDGDNRQWSADLSENEPVTGHPFGPDPVADQEFGHDDAVQPFSDDFLADELERSMQSLDQPETDQRAFSASAQQQPFYTDFRVLYPAPEVPAEDDATLPDEPDIPEFEPDAYHASEVSFEDESFGSETGTESADPRFEPAYQQVDPQDWASTPEHAALEEDVHEEPFSVEQPYPAVAKPDDVAAPEEAPENTEAAFDLDLNELELELSGIEPAETAREPLEQAVDNQSEDDGIFDPAELVSTDEPPAPVEDMDLPRDHVEEIERPSHQPEPYEFDLDEELADAMAAHGPVDPIAESQSQINRPQPVQAESEERVSEHQYDDDIEAALSEELHQAVGAAPVSHGFDDYYDEDDGAFETEKRPGWLAVTWMGYGRVIIGSVAVLGIAVLMIFAGLRYFSNEGGDDPMVIAADNSDVKEAPEDPGGEVVPNQDNAVFNNVEGTLSARPRQDNLIASDQEPADVENTAPNPLASGASMQSNDNASIETGIEPRKVRTIIVRPDGTLVEREGSTVAAGAEAPAAGQNGPTPSAGSNLETVTALPDENGNLISTGQQGAATAPDAQTGVENGADTAGASQTDTSEETNAFDGSGLTFDPYSVPLPERAPSNRVSQASSSAPSPAPSGGTQSAAPVNAAASQTGSSQYAMQIASLPSEQEARQAYQRLASQHPSVLGRQGVEYVAANVNGSTYYRVRIPAASLGDAISLCERYRGDGGSCFVPR